MNEYRNENRVIILIAIGAIIAIAGIANMLQDANILNFNSDIVGAIATVIIGVCIIVAAAIRVSNGQSRKS